jgi:hypothetical protein
MKSSVGQAERRRPAESTTAETLNWERVSQVEIHQTQTQLRMVFAKYHPLGSHEPSGSIEMAFAKMPVADSRAGIVLLGNSVPTCAD